MKPLRIAGCLGGWKGETSLQTLISFRANNSGLIEIVGVLPDNPFDRKYSPHKRFWKYLSDTEKRERVEALETLAKENGVDLLKDNIDDPVFREKIKKLNLDIIYTTCYGRLLPPEIFETPKYGTFNIHPAVDHKRWPVYAGPDPLEQMIEKGETHGALVMHRVNEKIDDGELIAYSGNFQILKGDTVPMLHVRTAGTTAQLIEWDLRDRFGLPQPSYGITAASELGALKQMKEASAFLERQPNPAPEERNLKTSARVTEHSLPRAERQEPA
jgi:methionyl-tRNA formyltransferase